MKMVKIKLHFLILKFFKKLRRCWKLAAHGNVNNTIFETSYSAYKIKLRQTIQMTNDSPVLKCILAYQWSFLLYYVFKLLQF